MNGWVIYNGHLKGTKFLDFAQWIQAAGAKQNVHIELVKNNHLFPIVSSERYSLIEIAETQRPDFVIFGDKDIPLARQLEYMNIPVFNSSSAIDVSDNKITTYQKLAREKLPIPQTIVAPKIFPGVVDIDMESFLAVETQFYYPMVVKEAYGSFGEQVYLIKTQEELLAKIIELKDKPYVIQEFISSSYGRDVRLNVVGDKVVASMLRTSKDDFRANVSAGGSMEVYQPTEEEVKLAISATKAIGADFAGVDLLFGENNRPIICEINSNAHIRNIYECTGVNVSDYIIEYVLDFIGC